MPELNERLLQFIWQHRLLPQQTFKTVSGIGLTVLHPGELNRDAGPDFFNARIRFADATLVGNVELHLRSSDWMRHGHQHDPAYDRLILHVVYQHDQELIQNSRHSVEVLEIGLFISQELLLAYGRIENSSTQLPCSPQLPKVSDVSFLSWLQRMSVERLESKTKRLEEIFVATGGDYAQTLYTLVLRSFGFSVNALPFELLAQELPFKLLLRHADNLLQVEALLFGMSGWLDEQLENKAMRERQNEFEFLHNKYGLRPLKKEIFKRSKMRPAGFPEVRLAQLARLIHCHSRLLLAPQEFANYDQLFRALSVGVPGKNSVDTIITNSFAPFFFFYGKKAMQPEYCDLALDLLTACGFETNRKTKLYGQKKTLLKSSADSQGLIHLHDQYCTKKACLNCAVGLELLRKR